MRRISSLALAALCGLATVTAHAAGGDDFQWPAGKRAAVTFSFDDARLSQVDTGLPLLDKHGVKATFLVSLDILEKRLDGWKKAIANGHDIGSHTGSHACTGNYAFSLKNALEDYDLPRMSRDLDRSIAEIKRLLGITPVSFAYPCGQKFVGRGREAGSYVPLVAGRFLVARGYLDEAANDPRVFDLSQAMGIAIDGLTPKEAVDLAQSALREGRWLIFVGHDVGKRAFQTTDVAALEAVIRLAKDPANGLWLDTMAAVGRHVRKVRNPAAMARQE